VASLDDVFLRLDGAKGHIETVERERELFIERKPYRFVRQEKPYEFKHLFRAFIYEQPPASLRRAVSGVLQDLRNSLDNLAYQLAVLETGQDPPPDEDGVAFPIFLKRKEFRKRSVRPLKNIGTTPCKEIVDLQPFNGAKALDPLWILHRLAQDDKHKKPVVVGSAVSNSGIHIKRMSGMLGFQDKTYFGPFEDNGIVAEVFARPGPGAELDMEFHLATDIAFPKKGPAKGRPILEVLPDLVTCVETEVIPKFEQFF
jgi:hypothetical protein